MPVVEPGGGLGGAGVGTAARLGEPERAERLTAGQQRQPFLPLLLVAEAVHGHRAQRHARFEGDRHALVDLAEFLQRQTQREVVPAHAAVLLGERQAEQPHVGHSRDHLVGERVLFVVLGGDRCDHALREVAHRLGQLFIVIGQGARREKVGHESSFWVASAESSAGPAWNRRLRRR